jgi:hypothetical protein
MNFVGFPTGFLVAGSLSFFLFVEKVAKGEWWVAAFRQVVLIWLLDCLFCSHFKFVHFS